MALLTAAAAARVLFALGGDHAAPSARNQRMFERRSLSAGNRLAFGEMPLPLPAVAVMTDGGNTHSQSTTRHRDISLR
jgi:Protein of unknown function (DUF3047)